MEFIPDNLMSTSLFLSFFGALECAVIVAFCISEMASLENLGVAS
jgi:hypothetical protein